MTQFCCEISGFIAESSSLRGQNLLPAEEFLFEFKIADTKRGDMPQLAGGVLAATVSLTSHAARLANCPRAMSGSPRFAKVS
jgi:hypothetical protein